jgi:hypothetical protein
MEFNEVFIPLRMLILQLTVVARFCERESLEEFL